MKTVTDKHTVAHLWAAQSQDHARTPTGNLYFRNESIYSYGSHFLIAKHIRNRTGQQAVLITKRLYSRTTSNQVGVVQAASKHLNQIIVPDPDQPAETLFDRWYQEIKEAAGRLIKARKPAQYVYQIRDIFAEAKRYADFFEHEVPLYLVQAGEIENIVQYAALLQKEEQYQILEDEKQKARTKKRVQQELKDWRQFKRHEIRSTDGLDYLRYRADTDQVETSQHVKIPGVTARDFYDLILKTIANGGCMDCKMTLMDSYQVSVINSQFICVGCHKIAMKEIRRFTKKLKW